MPYGSLDVGIGVGVLLLNVVLGSLVASLGEARQRL